MKKVFSISFLVCLLIAPSAGHAGGQSHGHGHAFKYYYVTEKGDDLYIVAKMYGVSMRRLKHWNRRKVRRHGRFKAGSKLVIRSKVPIRVKRKAWYVVQRGDALKRIARKLDVNIGVLRKLNHIHGDIIHPGDRLVYLLPGPSEDSESVGHPAHGKLVKGERMPEGPGYSYGHRPAVYGTNETVTHLIQCIGKYKRKYPKGPDVVVGNLSAKRGGKLYDHRSHQSGRDVDMGYIHKKKFQPVTHMIRTNRKNLDPRKTWYLIKCFLDTDDVHVIYVDYKIQKLLYEHLVKRHFVKRYLDKVFQYPAKRRGHQLIQDYPGHYHHMHIRFRCPKGDKRCQE